MKRFTTVVLTILFCGIVLQSFSQPINWKSLKSRQKHILNVHAGWDYGVVFGAGYSYQLKSKIPILLNASYSFPSGGKMMDDFKTKIGSQMRIYQIGHFQFSVSVHGIYRRYENPLVRLQNFGSEMKGGIGYYKPRWFLGAQVGFDKAIVTHFKHSESFKTNVYEDVKDGWYQPSTGGNFNYGIQMGYTFKNSDITFEIGKVISQNFKATPLIPYYLQLGYNYRIKGRKLE